MSDLKVIKIDLPPMSDEEFKAFLKRLKKRLMRKRKRKPDIQDKNG